MKLTLTLFLVCRGEWETFLDVDGCSRQRINQYIIKDEIGHGSYGAVRLATDQFGKEYAIKQFSKSQLSHGLDYQQFSQMPRGLERFRQALELLVVSQLSVRPNMIQQWAMGAHRPEDFERIIMETSGEL